MMEFTNMKNFKEYLKEAFEDYPLYLKGDILYSITNKRNPYYLFFKVCDSSFKNKVEFFEIGKTFSRDWKRNVEIVRPDTNSHPRGRISEGKIIKINNVFYVKYGSIILKHWRYEELTEPTGI